MIRSTCSSCAGRAGHPSGRRITFEAAGKIFIADLHGTPHRLTSASFHPLELSPAWSPDGQWVAFTSFDDEKLGHLWKIRVNGASGGEMTQLTKVAGEYLQPAWAPDGHELVVTRGTGGFLRQHSWSNNSWYELRRVSASGNSEVVVTTVNRPYVARAARACRAVRSCRRSTAPADGSITPRHMAARVEADAEPRQRAPIQPERTSRPSHQTAPTAGAHLLPIRG